MVVLYRRSLFFCNGVSGITPLSTFKEHSPNVFNRDLSALAMSFFVTEGLLFESTHNISACLRSPGGMPFPPWQDLLDKVLFFLFFFRALAEAGRRRHWSLFDEETLPARAIY